MATKQQAYDHSAYITPIDQGFVTSSAATGRFCAFTPTIIKSMSVALTAAATNNSTWAFVRVLGTATSTVQTVTVGTATALGSYSQTVAMATNTVQALNNILLGTQTLAAGEVFSGVFSGADSVGMSVGIEAYIAPGANLTV